LQESAHGKNPVSPILPRRIADHNGEELADTNPGDRRADELRKETVKWFRDGGGA